MFFFTYSEGFRPGGFNRTAGVPTTYFADEATNYELGWKSTLFDGSLRFNASLYKIYWDGLQVGITDFDISVITFTSFPRNRRVPVTSSKRMTPNANTSARRSRGRRPCRCRHRRRSP